jgi:hypothetical protein
MARMGLLNKIVPEREYCCQTRGCWNQMRALGNTVSRHSGAANFQSEFEIKSSVARNKMARVPHPLIWPMPSAEILRRMLQLGLSRAIIVYPGDAGAPNSNAHRPDQELPAGNAGPLFICPRVQKSRSAGRVRVSELVSEWVSNCSQGVALNGIEHLPTGICALARVFWRVRDNAGRSDDIRGQGVRGDVKIPFKFQSAV